MRCRSLPLFHITDRKCVQAWYQPHGRQFYQDLYLRAYDGTVRCEILNSNHPKSGQDKSGSGVGLEQVSKRLELIYPGHYEWIKGVSEDGQVYSSILTIQTKSL